MSLSESGDGVGVPATEAAPRPMSRGSSVSQLVKSYDDVSTGGKRDRSGSGDSPVPTGKRGAPDRGRGISRSPMSAQSSVREHFDAAIESLEDKMTAFISSELHSLRDVIQSQLETLSTRLSDLERHTEARDQIIDDLSQELKESREEIARIKARAEESEIISRLPCLVLSGGAMAARPAPPLPAGGPAADGPPPGAAAGGPPCDQEQRRPAARAGPGEASGAGRGARLRSGENVSEEPEDIHALVVRTLNQNMSGLNMCENDIDRAHRLPGPNNRVIVRFVRSGAGSVRDRVMWRRLELSGKELYVNESLTPLRGQIYRSLLNAKKEKKLHTVFTRGGHVFFKPEKFGKSVRVDSLDRVRELGFSVLENEGQRTGGAGRGGGVGGSRGGVGGGGGRAARGPWESAVRR